MDLLEILRNILYTKNEIRDIVGETDNIARYSVAIHNMLAKEYNTAYRNAYNERCLELINENRWVTGPEEILPYDVDDKYYAAFTTEILTDIMRDVLNYRLGMKDEIEHFTEQDIGNNFVTYPDWLRGMLATVVTLGAQAGVDKADEDFEGDEQVDVPTFLYSSNRFTITTEQAGATIFYKLDADGIETMYTGPVIISDSYDVYYWARIGMSNSPKSTYVHCEWSSSGMNAFVYPPVVNQQNNIIYLTCSTNNATIEYQIDDGYWLVYNGPILILPSNTSITARAYNNGEYSKKVTQPITYTVSTDDARPADVRCSIVDNSGVKTVTLWCDTAGADIYYAINDNTGYYVRYTEPFTVSETSFLIYVWSEKNGLESPHRLCYMWTDNVDPNKPQNVQFIDDGDSVTMYTVTQNATISYRYGSAGSYTITTKSSVKISPTYPVDIYAFCELNGIPSDETHYSFYPQGYTSKPPKPSMTLNGDVVVITSNYPVYYTTDLSDPMANGVQYNTSTGIKIESTVTIKAVAVNNGVASDYSIATFVPFGEVNYDGNGGGGGSNPGGGSGGGGQGGGQGGGGGTDIPTVTDQTPFTVTGIERMTFVGDLQWSEDGSNWNSTTGGQLTGLDTSKKYMLRGTVSRISTFVGNAVIAGNPSLIVGGGQNFQRLFSSCRGLVNADGIYMGFTSMNSYEMAEMFNGCVDLVSAQFTLGITSVAERGMEGMFRGCTSLRYGPSFTIRNIGRYGCSEMFSGCNALEKTGSFNLEQQIRDYCMNECFLECHKIYRPVLTTGQYRSDSTCQFAFKNCFKNCAELDPTDISLNLMTLDTGIYQDMFYGCTGIKTFSSLPAEQMQPSCYREMFYGCSSMTAFGSIGATTLADSCMNGMFKGCSLLQRAPELRAERLANNCYKEMFYGCSRLNWIKAMFVDNPASGACTDNWVRGVAATGTFEQNDTASWYVVGYNGIPEGWTIKKGAVVGRIIDIVLNGVMVTILASTSDSIYYNLSTQPDTTLDNLQNYYSGPFELLESCYVNACCKNADGVWGIPVSKYIEYSLPELVIGCSDNDVSIYCPYNFNYDTIEYQLCTFQTTTVVQQYTNYNGPFHINQSYTVQARGRYDGKYGPVTTVDILFGLNSPTIEFGPRYCSLSYPNASEYTRVTLYYKLNDASKGNPPEGWTQYTQSFVYTNDLEGGVCLVTAIAKVRVNGQDYWSPMTSRMSNEGSSVNLSIPILKKVDNSTNNVILEYEGMDYPTWTKTSVKIAYRFFSKEAHYYTGTFSLIEAREPYSGNIDVYAQAQSGNVMTDWYKYELYYDASLEHFDVNAPTIRVESINGTNTLYITKNNDNPEFYSVETYFWVEITEKDAVGGNPSGSCYSGYTTWSAANGFVLWEHIYKATIHAYCKINGDTSTVATYEFTNPYTIFNLDEPRVEFRLVNGVYWLYITDTTGGTTDNMQFRFEDTKWAASGTVDEHKYDGWTNCGRTGQPIDTHLGYGNCYVKYQNAGLDSDEFGPYEFYDDRVVTGLVAPVCELVEMNSNGVKYYMLIPVSNPNEATWLQFRIVDCVWNGGVVDTHKYDNWAILPLYGTSLSEYLVSGTIEVRAYLDATHYSEDVWSYEFESGYAGLATPEILFFIKDNDEPAFKVSNMNPLATNQFKMVNTVWDGQELNPNKYDDWGTCFITYNDIDIHLVSATVQARSLWGDEESSTAEAEYVSTTVLNSDPPTIAVALNADEMSYTVTITNNADSMAYPFIKYHMIDITWEAVDENGIDATLFNKYVKNKSNTYQDDWLRGGTNIQREITFDIVPEVKKGTIEAFGTNETTNIIRDRDARTPLAIYEFEREE